VGKGGGEGMALKKAKKNTLDVREQWERRGDGSATVEKPLSGSVEPLGKKPKKRRKGSVGGNQAN